jgi:DNA sulfur modification protein DndC
MRPLWEFRKWLYATTDPKRKREFRDIKGRDGRVILKKDGTPAARTYKLETSKQVLERVLRAQLAVRTNGPDPTVTLISEGELHEIRRIWRTERQDWDDSVPLIFRQVNGYNLDWPMDDDSPFDSEHKRLLSNICKEYDVPFDLIAGLLEAERRTAGMARRAGIQKALASVFAEEWRTEEEILAAAAEEPVQLPLM